MARRDASAPFQNGQVAAVKDTGKIRKIPVDKLGSFSSEFDIFFRSYTPSEELLRKDLYIPIPLCGKKIVWGFHLIEAAESMGLKSLICREVEDDTVGLLKLALTLENRREGFSWEEKAHIYKLLVDNNCVDRWSELAPLIDSKGSFVRLTEKYLLLNETLRSMVDNNEIDLKNALRIGDLPEEVLTFIRKSKLSFSQRRVILSNLYEIWKRDKLSKKQFLNVVQRVLSAKNPQREAEKIRYPELARMEERYCRFKREELDGTGIELSHPPGFEGDSFTVSFSFSGKEDLSARIESLKLLRDKCDRLLELL